MSGRVRAFTSLWRIDGDFDQCVRFKRDRRFFTRIFRQDSSVMRFFVIGCRRAIVAILVNSSVS